MSMGADKERALEATNEYLEWFSSQVEPVQEARSGLCKAAPCKRAFLGTPLRGHVQVEHVPEPERTAGTGSGKEIPDRLSLYWRPGVPASDGGRKRRVGRQAVLQETDSGSGNLV